jgi:hypothetical protein
MSPEMELTCERREISTWVSNLHVLTFVSVPLAVQAPWIHSGRSRRADPGARQYAIAWEAIVVSWSQP